MNRFYDRKRTARRLKAMRVALQMTQVEVAFRSGITQSALSNYENGRREIPLSVLVALAAALGIRPVELVPGLLEVPSSDAFAALYG